MKPKKDELLERAEKILGIYEFPMATQEDAKKNYHRQAKLVHPDKPTGNNELFILIKQAYNLLQGEGTRTSDLENDELVRILVEDITPIEETEEKQSIMERFYDQRRKSIWPEPSYEDSGPFYKNRVQGNIRT